MLTDCFGEREGEGGGEEERERKQRAKYTHNGTLEGQLTRGWSRDFTPASRVCLCILSALFSLAEITHFWQAIEYLTESCS